MNWYQGRKVFITGGSSGIGRATARLLVRAGASVMIAARGAARLEEAVAELEAERAGSTKLPDQVIASLEMDVSDRAAVATGVPVVLDRLAGIDVLINNAGISHPGYIHEVPDSVYDSMMAVNYFGTVNVTRAFLPRLQQQQHGHIANVSSMLGFMGIFGYAAYAASKFAVVGFSESLRQDLLASNIKVSVLYPPDTDTPQLETENRIKPPETKALSGSIKPMSADDVARALLAGIEAGRLHIVPGLGGRLVHFGYRHLPGLMRVIMDRDLRAAQTSR